LKKNNKIAMDFIWEGLPNPVREKVGKCSSAKELLDHVVIDANGLIIWDIVGSYVIDVNGLID
jgi:hypothetical protein